MKKLITCLAVASAVEAANAGTFTYTASYTSSTWSGSNTFLIPKFSPNRGNLTKITVIFDQADNFSYFGMENDFDFPQILTLSTDLPWRFTPPIGSAIEDTDNLTRVAVLTAYDGVFDFGGTSGVNFAPLRLGTPRSIVYTSAAALKAFKGSSGSLPCVSERGTPSVASDGNVSWIVSVGVTIKLTVIYEYR